MAQWVVAPPAGQPVPAAGDSWIQSFSCAPSDDDVVSNLLAKNEETISVEVLSAMPFNVRALGSMRFSMSRPKKIKPADNPAEILRLHDLTDNYSVVQENLGRGHFGAVHEVKCRRTGRHYALKTVIFEGEKGEKLMQQEIANSAEFDHPFIVKMHGFFLEDNRYHIIMDLCTGGNLREHLMKTIANVRTFQPTFVSGLSSPVAQRFIYQIVAGLMFLHHWGYVHRDIKPDNYLLADDTLSSPLKLSDFGLTCRVARGELLQRGAGTSSFLAPEVIRGSYNQKCDIWSAGVTVYMLCTGAYPFRGDTTEEYLRNVLLGNFDGDDRKEWAPHPPHLRELAMSMMDMDHEKRPSAKDLLSTIPWLNQYHKRAVASGSCCTLS